MGHRVTQRIFECDVCDVIPEDGQYLWEMCGVHWCEDCCEYEENLEDDLILLKSEDEL